MTRSVGCTARIPARPVVPDIRNDGSPCGAIDSTVRHGWKYYWKSTYLPELSDDLVNVLTEHAFASASPRSYAAMFHLGGAVGRVAGGDTAFGNRQVSHTITLDAVWRPGEEYGDQDIAWSRGFFAALDRFHVNFLGADEEPDRVREAYGDAVYDRLASVKATYDPDNVFRHNQNIGPREMKARTAAAYASA